MNARGLSTLEDYDLGIHLSFWMHDDEHERNVSTNLPSLDMDTLTLPFPL